MSRIGYLRIHRFQTVVHQKHENLKGQPFALITGKLTPGGYARARIFMCSEEAYQRGVEPGQRLSEAKAVCSDLILRKCDDGLYANTQKQLLQNLVSCSPRVTSENIGEFSLDASGLMHIGGETTFCHNVLRLCAQAGLPDAHIGVADSTFAAMVASRLKRKTLYVVPRGQDRKFLAPLSIVHLELEPELQETLIHLGVKSMGQLAQLPVDSLIDRFGPTGKVIHDLAQGIDSRHPTIPEAPKRFECSIDMGGAISSLNETMFALKSMLDRLTMELERDGLWADELTVSFYNENDLFNERKIRLIRSSNQSKFLLEVIRLSLEADPLVREFTLIKLSVSRFSTELWEQHLIDSPEISSTEKKLSTPLVLLLQRFLTRLGDHKAVKPVASDHYTHKDAGAWVSVAPAGSGHTPQDAVIPNNIDYLRKDASSGKPLMGASDLVLRKSVTNKVIVQLDDAIPTAINYQKQWYRVTHITTPEYLSGDWWGVNSAKTYYKILAEPINKDSESSAALSLMLLTHDEHNDSWLIEGLYD
jgi:nucleotidyltransferase/DNA polymerase involved in DNA repair